MIHCCKDHPEPCGSMAWYSAFQLTKQKVMRQDIRKLLAEVSRQRAEIERLQQANEKLINGDRT